jgi:light-regulated signal transduction histidine kinase (bacteriophytochrome)
METSNYIAIAMILGGSVIMLLSIFTTRRLFTLFPDNQFRKGWQKLYLLMIFFLVGYIAAIYIVTKSNYSWLVFLAGFIFLCGAAFVYLVVRLGLATFKKLQETNRRLELRTQELAQRNNELEQFAYTTSHDLQEPLRTIMDFSELLNKDDKSKIDQQAKYRQFILQAAVRMNTLINDLLDHSRIGKGKQITTIDCNVLIKEVLNDMTGSISATNAVFHISELPKIKGTETEFRLLFQNLLSNAIKFRKKNSIPHISISAQKENGHYRFSFKDNGIGILDEHRERIFVIFQRLHTRNEYEGTGIGLAHCRKIVNLYSGKIWFDSKYNEGSTFHFTIPG